MFELIWRLGKPINLMATAHKDPKATHVRYAPGMISRAYEPSVAAMGTELMPISAGGTSDGL
jgi:hypothetical protein